VLGALLIACVLMLGIVVWQLVPRGGQEEQATSDGRPQGHPPAPAQADAAVGVPEVPEREAVGAVADREDSEAPPLSDVAAGGSPAVEQADGLPQPAETASRPAVRWVSDPDRRRAERRLAAAREGLATDPSNPAALRDGLAAARQLGRWAEARRMLARLVEVEPENTEVRFEYAVTLMRLSRWVDAVHALEDVVAQQPDRGPGWYNLAVAHQALGHLAEARRAWDRTIELLPNNPDAHAHRGEVLLDLHEWSAAAADFEAALQREPDDVEAALNLSLALWKLGRLDEAQARVAGVIERHARHVAALNRMAELCWALYEMAPEANRAQHEAAITYWRRSLEIDQSQSAVEAALKAAVGGGGTP
jgi:tetratricopeptide (TPR) repeat protein